MKLPEAIIEAVKAQNSKMLSQIVLQLRMQCKYDYNECQTYIEKLTGLPLEEYENMMYEADSNSE